MLFFLAIPAICDLHFYQVIHDLFRDMSSWFDLAYLYAQNENNFRINFLQHNLFFESSYLNINQGHCFGRLVKVQIEQF